jgi:hypothetical protein
MTHLAHLITDPTPALTLFGNDHLRRPHAAWFTSDELVVAERASGPLGYVALRVTNEEHVFARLLPRGDIGRDGQVHVPPLSPEMVEALCALLVGSQQRSVPEKAAQHQRRLLSPRYRRPALRQLA